MYVHFTSFCGVRSKLARSIKSFATTKQLSFARLNTKSLQTNKSIRLQYLTAKEHNITRLSAYYSIPPLFFRSYATRGSGEQESDLAENSSVQTPPGKIGEVLTRATKPLVQWTEKDVETWFLSSKYASRAKDFQLDGKDLASLTKEDFERITKNTAQGISLYNAVQDIKKEYGYTFKFEMLCSPGIENYLLSKDLNNINLPPNPDRKFNFSGPVDYTKHYCIPGFLRSDSLSLNTVFTLINDGKYFVLHEQRQSGKTSYIRELRDYLNCVDKRYAALYVNVEKGQTAWNDVDKGITAVINAIDMELNRTFCVPLDLMENTQKLDPFNRLEEALNIISKELSKQGKKLVLFIDEIDSLVGDVLLTVLRQLRAGYVNRMDGTFPHSVVLIGLRNIRDYKIYSEMQQKYVLGGSAFNISAATKRVKRFSKEHVQALMNLHTNATKQSFDDKASDVIMVLTDGQPWLVNRLLYECVTVLKPMNSGTVTADDVYQASQNIIHSRATHIDNLAQYLQENRVRKVIEPLITDGKVASKNEDDIEYCEDLGLIKRTVGGLKISNEIYRDVIPRILTNITVLQERLNSINRVSYIKDGKIDLPLLLNDFKQFYRENIGFLRDSTTYKESVYHLLLYAYLQRVVNDGGMVHSCYSLGDQIIDILIEWPLEKGVFSGPKQREVIEVKTVRNGDKRKRDLVPLKEAAVEQTAKYLQTLNLQEGYVVIFDQRSGQVNKLNEEEIVKNSNKKITIFHL